MKTLDFIQKNKKWIARVVITLILVSGILWIVYQPKDAIESLVPEHASWFIEIERPIEVLKGSQKGLRFFSDPNLTVFAEWQQQLEFVRQLLGKEAEINKFISNSTLGISSHILSGKESGYIFYIALPSSKHESLFALLRKFYGGKRDFFYQEREYMGKKICEVTFKKNNITFSVSGSDGALVGSFSGFLVEEVVRKSGLIFKANFVSKLRKDSRFSGLASKPVRLFINLPKLPEYFFQYLNPSLKGLLLARTQGTGMALGFDAPRGLSWDTEGYLLQENPKEMHQHENELDVNMLSMVPSNYAILFQYQLGNLWQNLPDRKWSNPDPALDSLPIGLKSQALLCLAEGEGLKKYNKLFIAPIRNKSALEAWLAFHTERKTGEKPYLEKTGNTEIRQVTNPKFGSILGGSLFEDWMPLFYAEKDNYLVISDDLDLLKKSIGTNRNALQEVSTQNPAFFRFRFLVSRCVPLLMESAQGIFKNNFQDWIPLLKSVSILSLQDHGQKDNPSFTFEVKWKLPGNLTQNFNTLVSHNLDTTLLQGPFRLESGKWNQVNWSFLDKNLNAHVFGQNLESRFQVKLGSNWSSKPQILESQNEKLVSVSMATKGSLHVFDGKGQEEKGFPVSLPDSSISIENMRVVDYDHSLQYRFFIGSRYGDVYTCDQKGKFLDGWRPRKMENPLSQAPQHFRIGDKDLMVMLDNMGTLTITNRKGELMPGFPVKLNARSTQPMFYENGLSLKNSFVYILSDIGEMEKVNMLGEKSSRIQLYRPDKNTAFQFLIDQREKTFCVARISANTVSIFDQSYRPVFDFNTSSQEVLVQHFHFGASNKIFAITDLKERKTYLLDETGQLLRPEPFESDGRIDIVPKPKSETGFHLVKVFGKQVSLLEFEKE